jgi:hypothetical protein
VWIATAYNLWQLFSGFGDVIRPPINTATLSLYFD